MGTITYFVWYGNVLLAEPYRGTERFRPLEVASSRAYSPERCTKRSRFRLSTAVERKGREGRKIKTILSFAFFAIFAFDRDMFS
jgi:hypothetical protein